MVLRRPCGDRLIPTNDATCVLLERRPPASAPCGAMRSEDALHALLTAAGPGSGRPGCRRHSGWPDAGWSGAVGYLRHCWGPGWALVGDAGYFKDPITTHGMSDALRDAELLADAVLAVLSGPMKPPSWRIRAHAGSAFRDMFNVTEAVAAYDWELDRVRHLLREVSSAMGEEVDHLQSLPQRGVDLILCALTP